MRQMVNIAQGWTGSHNFPLSNFRYFLTLFSKFFSSFAHATCSLSVSRQYLALDEVYHPFCAVLPNNATLRTCTVRGELQVTDGTLTLYDPFFQKSYTWVTRWPHVIDYNSQHTVKVGDLNFELFPLHSPLLGESLLVSFPPLNNMLKFSGCARLP